MRSDDLASELEKLKSRRVELASRSNITRDGDEKEEIKLQIERLQKQIDTLEKFYGKGSIRIMKIKS